MCLCIITCISIIVTINSISIILISKNNCLKEQIDNNKKLLEMYNKCEFYLKKSMKGC